MKITSLVKIFLVIQGVGGVVVVAVAVVALVGTWLLPFLCAEAVFPFLASLSKHIN